MHPGVTTPRMCTTSLRSTGEPKLDDSGHDQDMYDKTGKSHWGMTSLTGRVDYIALVRGVVQLVPATHRIVSEMLAI